MVEPLVWVFERILERRIVECGELVRDHARFESERLIDRPHPATAQTRQLVVRGDQVGALIFERVQIQR